MKPDEYKIVTNKLAACISIPKCATHTIRNMFDMGFNRANDEDDISSKYIIYENHKTLKALEKKYDVNNLFIFTFVRNPYDRCRSWFAFCKNDIEEYKNLTIDEWVKQGCNTHWKIQNKTDWAADQKSPLLQYNFIEGNKQIDFIGKVENFENDCKKLIEMLNDLFKKNQIDKTFYYKDLKLNKSNSDEEKLSDESKEIIYTLFKKDFEYFHYKK